MSQSFLEQNGDEKQMVSMTTNSHMVLVSHSGDLAVVQYVDPYSNNKQSAFSVSNLTK